MTEPLKFQPAIIQSVKTTCDGGVRLSFDIDAGQSESAAVLMMLRAKDTSVDLTVEINE